MVFFFNFPWNQFCKTLISFEIGIFSWNQFGTIDFELAHTTYLSNSRENSQISLFCQMNNMIFLTFHFLSENTHSKNNRILLPAMISKQNIPSNYLFTKEMFPKLIWRNNSFTHSHRQSMYFSFFYKHCSALLFCRSIWRIFREKNNLKVSNCESYRILLPQFFRKIPSNQRFAKDL